MHRARRGFWAVVAALSLVTGCSQDAGVADVLVVSRVEITPPNSAIVIGQNLQLAATPLTEGGIALPSRNVTWTSTNASTATVSQDGLVHGESVGGPVKIRATVEGVTGETDITVVAFPIDHIIVTPPGFTLTVGATAQFAVTAYDAAGAPLTGRTFLWGSSAPTTVGVTTTGLVLALAPGGPVTISASTEGKSASGAVTVISRPATRVGFVQQPTSAVAGAAITPPIQVAIRDDLLGTVPTGTHSVTLELASNPGNATLSGTKTVPAVNGIATFADLSLNRTGVTYTLTATSSGLTPATSTPFNIAAGPAAQLTFTTAPPLTANSGVAFASSPVVQVRDAAGNAVLSAGIVVTATVTPTTATLGGTSAATTDASGAATFTALSLSGVPGPYTLSFTAPNLSPLASGIVDLKPAPATALQVTVQPSATAQSGVVLARQPAVRLLDAAGNSVQQSGVLIAASIASGPAGASLTGLTGVATNTVGVAVFSNLTLNGPAGSYQLRFSSPALAPATSSAVVLSAGSGSVLGITTQPSAQAASGAPFAQQPVIQLLDAARNPVAQANVVIGASIQSGGGTLGGTLTATTNSAGQATFLNLSLTGTPGPRTLGFGATGYVSVASTPISVTAPVATGLTVAVQPSPTAQNGVPMVPQPVLQVVDGVGVPVSQAGVAILVAISQGNGTLGGTTTVLTNASGRAQFAGLVITGKVGNYVLTFSSSGLGSVASSAIALTPGVPATLTIGTQPPGTAQNGVAFSPPSMLQVQDGSANGVSGVVVSVSANPGSGTLGGATTAATNAAGQATFTGLSLTGKLRIYTLTFSALTLASVTSTGIDLTAGPPIQLLIQDQPSPQVQSGQPFPKQPIIQLLDAGANPVDGVAVSATINSCTGIPLVTLGGITSLATDNGGFATYQNLSLSVLLGSPTCTLKFSSGSLARNSSNIKIN